jgi:hypothetical protein
MSDDLISPNIGSIWRHYKGGEYRVTGWCRIEATNEVGVLYVPMSDLKYLPWCRPLRDWHQTVPGHGPRFSPIEDAEL